MSRFVMPSAASVATRRSGIWTMPIGRDCSGSAKLTIPGASDPDWGPAQPGGGSQPGPARPGVVVPRKLGGSRLTIAITCPGPCSATATARAGRRTVARSTKRLSGAGKVALRPKRLRGARRLAVEVTVKPDGGAAMTVTRSVKVRR